VNGAFYERSPFLPDGSNGPNPIAEAVRLREPLCNTAACDEISPMGELAKGRFAPDRNFPAGCLIRPRNHGGKGSRAAAGEPIPFRCGVADRRGHTCD